MKKLLALSLCLLLICLASCAEDISLVLPESYSVGLDEDGYYEGMDFDSLGLPDIDDLVIEEEDLLQYALDQANDYAEDETGYTTTIQTTEDYLYQYASQSLISAGYANKDVVEEDDFVTPTISFVDEEGNEIEDLGGSETKYVASSEGDEIIASFIGKKEGDEYSIEYTFDESDDTYGGKTYTCNITIDTITWQDPLANNILEENLEEIQGYLGDDVVDEDTFIEAMKSSLFSSIGPSYLEQLIQSLDIEVPDECMEYEMERLNFRLNLLGMTYKKYLKEAETTDEEVREIVKSAVIENLMCMREFKTLDTEITDDILIEKFGEESIQDLIDTQGKPYLKLEIMRSTALASLFSKTGVISDVDS